jgi:hypothetical protein
VRVSGFSIVRNGIRYGYPFIEAVTSILPLCDEFILNVGTSDDGTLELAKSIGSSKLIILQREWDMSLREGGRLISVETNHALAHCRGDWCFYVQADEVVHEQYVPVLQESMQRYLQDERVEALQFGYKHFYGSYDFYQDNYRYWYVKENRIIKRDPNIVSWGDGMDFRHRDGSPLRCRRIPAEIYHYGWVRPPKVMHAKSIGFHQLYHADDEEVRRKVPSVERTYHHLGHLRRFTGTHPAVMSERIAASVWDFDSRIDEQPPDWWRHIWIFLHPLTKRLTRWLGVNRNATI